MQKKRPCAVCRSWFLPDVRVGVRQRTCGAGECQRERHRRACGAWRRRDPDYDRARRWQASLDRAKAGEGLRPPREPRILAGVPWDLVRDVMKPEGAEILAGVAGVLARYTRDERRRYLSEPKGESGGLPPGCPRDEMEEGPRTLAG